MPEPWVYNSFLHLVPAFLSVIALGGDSLEEANDEKQ